MIEGNVKKLFENLVRDADNWGGCPLFGEDGTYSPVLGYKEDRALLAHLKRAGLVKSVRDERRNLFIYFTEAGAELGKQVAQELELSYEPYFAISH